MFTITLFWVITIITIIMTMFLRILASDMDRQNGLIPCKYSLFILINRVRLLIVIIFEMVIISLMIDKQIRVYLHHTHIAVITIVITLMLPLYYGPLINIRLSSLPRTLQVIVFVIMHLLSKQARTHSSESSAEM